MVWIGGRPWRGVLGRAARGDVWREAVWLGLSSRQELSSMQELDSRLEPNSMFEPSNSGRLSYSGRHCVTGPKI